MLFKFNGCLIDPSKVSFIGPIDHDIFHHVNTTIYYFEIVVDGCKIKLTACQKEDAVSFRDTLINNVATDPRS